MNEYIFSVITDIDDLHSIKNEWGKLASYFSTPLIEYEWFVTFAECNAEISLHVITVRSGGELVALAPLFIKHNRLANMYKLIGISELYEPSSVLYKDGDSLTALMTYLARSKYATILERIQSSSNLATFGHKSIDCVSYVRDSACSYYLKTDMSTERMEASIRKSRLQDMNRKRRKLAKLGGAEFKAIEVTQTDFSEYFSIAVDVEANGWKGAAGSAMASCEILYKFFYNYCYRMAGLNKLIIFLLYSEKRPIAMHIAINHAGRLWILKLGHIAKFSQYSPGILMAMHTIEYACSHGFTQYEFLGSGEDWQQTWPVERHDYVTIFIFPHRLTGYMGMLQVLYDKLIGRST